MPLNSNEKKEINEKLTAASDDVLRQTLAKYSPSGSKPDADRYALIVEEIDRRNRPVSAPQPEGSFMDVLNDALYLGQRPAIQGVVEGLLTADSISDIPSKYREVERRERGKVNRYWEENPVTSNLVTLGAGLLSGGSAAKKLGTDAYDLISEPVQEGVSAFQRFLNRPSNVAVPATVGAVYGAGTSPSVIEDDPVGLLSSGAQGGLLGALLNKFINPNVGKTIYGDDSATINKLAERQFQRAIERDDMTPGQVRANLRKMPEGATIADAGGANTAGLAEAVITMPGKGANLGTQKMLQRRDQAPNRVSQLITNLMGGKDYLTVESDLINRLRTAAAPFYKTAYNTMVSRTDTIKALEKRPMIADAMKQAEIDMRNDPRTTAGHVKLFDYTQRRLRDIQEEATRVGRKNEADLARVNRQDLLREVDKQVPSFATARKLYAEGSSSVDALEAGRKIFSGDSAEYTKLINKFIRENEQLKKELGDGASAGNLELFRLGAMEAVRQRVMLKPEGGDIVKGIFNNPEMKSRIRRVFDDPRDYAQFERAMRNEGRMFEVQAQATRNSRTFNRQALSEDFDRNLGADILDAGQMVAGNTTAGLGTAITRKLAEKWSNYQRRKGGEQVRDAIAQVLFKGNRREQEALLMRLEALERGGRFLPPESGILGPSRTGGAAQVTGGLLGGQTAEIY